MSMHFNKPPNDELLDDWYFYRDNAVRNSIIYIVNRPFYYEERIDWDKLIALLLYTYSMVLIIICLLNNFETPKIIKEMIK